MARINSVELLVPIVQRQILDLMDNLPEGWIIFETYRKPSDQYSMKLKGTSKVPPMHSAHQYGLAADVIPTKDGKPWWPNVGAPEWSTLHEAVQRFCPDLECPIQWDPGHVQWVGWPEFHKNIR